MKPYVIIACSGAKAEGKHVSAGERYTGSFYRLALAAALRLTDADDVRIASARYGLLCLEADTEPYNIRLDALGRDDARQWLSKVHGAACSMWGHGRYGWQDRLLPRPGGHRIRDGRPGTPVYLLTPSTYTERLLTLPMIDRNAVRPLPFEGCRGIGDMRHVLSTLAPEGA